MTNRKLAKSNANRPPNQKDHRPPHQTKASRRNYDAKLAEAGFTWVGLKLTYTWPGVFPAFILAPGIATDETGTHAGLIARCGDIEILFPYGSDPEAMAAQLDDEILEVMRLQADVDAPLDWQPVVIDGQEIGPEVAF
jgi:hypothetical protein